MNELKTYDTCVQTKEDFDAHFDQIITLGYCVKCSREMQEYEE